MRKSLIIRIFVGIIGVIALTACASSTAAHTPDDNLNNNIGNAIYYDYGFQGAITHWKGLNMYVAAGSITPTGMCLSMINDNSELNFGHGVPFSIEQYSRGRWRQVPFINDMNTQKLASCLLTV